MAVKLQVLQGHGLAALLVYRTRSSKIALLWTGGQDWGAREAGKIRFLWTTDGYLISFYPLKDLSGLLIYKVVVIYIQKLDSISLDPVDDNIRIDMRTAGMS